jgi:signal transduction histidine kinase
MIPNKVKNTYIEISINFNGNIRSVKAGLFCAKEFHIGHSIYILCPFLEKTLDDISKGVIFTINGMVICSHGMEYNVDVSFLRQEEAIAVLIEDRTQIYQYLSQLNQHRNDLYLLKNQIAKQNIELERLRQVAEKANEEKTRFLAIMSHEVRNPLNSILAYADIIQSEAPNEEIKKYAKSLIISGNNLNVIVNDILDISRVEAGKFEMLSKPMSIKEVVETCVASSKVQYQKSAVKIAVVFSGKFPKFVLGDPVRMSQILCNLIKNAYKFTKKGQITVRVAVVCNKNNRCTINFKIEDTGRGLTTKQLGRIFNEYEQSHISDFMISKVMGLGLSIVKRLVEAMQGTVGVESILGVGSVFYFQIPFQTTKPPKEETPQIFSTDISKLKILFAEDDLLNQSIVKHFLKKEEVDLTVVNDGIEALKTLYNETFDLVLLDIQMPRLTGEDLINKRAQFSKENREIPTIAVTANVSEKDIARYQKAGFKDVLCKPFNAEKLILSIQKNRV